jgi:hypothetical protein
MIKLYKIYKELTEGIKISDDDKYEVEYTKDTTDDLIRLSDELSYRKNDYGDVVMIGIPVQKSQNKSKLINDLKKGTNLTPEVISKVTDKIISNLMSSVDLNEFDYIVSPKSSSDLTREFISKLKAVTSTPVYISDLFLKNDVNKIWLDFHTASKELSNKYLKKLVKDFERSKEIDGQPLKLQPLTNFQRKYVRDMLKINPKYDSTLVDMLDKRILVIDDVLTSGKTLNDIKLILSTLNINEVILFVMFG